jgi:uncharacterized membrane protein
LVDALRGIAVVAMVYIHVEHAFADPQRISPAFDTASNYFGGWAAPTFLFLAGLSAAWASAKTKARTLASRGLDVWLWAMVFRLLEWLVGGSGARAGDMLRVDVLNCIGVSLILVAGALALVQPLLVGHLRAIPLALIGAAIFSATPFVRATPWLAHLPPQLAWYFAGPPQMAPFPLFGWSGFAFFGAALGLATLSTDRNRMLLRAAALGALVYAPLFLLRSYSPAAVGFARSDFNPYNMAERLALTTALFGLANALRPLHGWLALLGRHSLLVYCVHVDLCYGLLFYHWQHTFGAVDVLAAAAAMITAMTFLARGQERLVVWVRQTMLQKKRAVRA